MLAARRPRRAARPGLRATCVGTVALAASLALVLGAGVPASAVGVDSGTAATQQQIDAVLASLDALEATAAERSDQAVSASAARADADSALVEADALADQLSGRAAEAELAEEAAHQQAGQLAAHLARAGRGASTTSVLLGSDHPDDVLQQLGTLTQLGERWQGVMSDATLASNTLVSLRDQREAARQERERLADEAAARAADARSAQATADDEVAAATTRAAELYAQLAALRQTTPDVERETRRAAAVTKSVEAAGAAAANDRGPSAPSVGSGAGAGAPSAPAPAPVAPAPVAPAPVAPAPVAPAPAPAPSPAPTPAPPAGVVNDPAGAKAYAASRIGTGAEYDCLVQLWNKESGWRTNATNPTSGAYGIPQAWPAKNLASAGLDWQTSYRTQVNWGLSYIASRYKTPCGAWGFWVRNTWY